MYCSFYGFAAAPFELTANPKYLFLTAQHREALSNLEYGLSSAKPITVLTGEAGTGKSTLLNAAVESERCHHVTCVVLNNPALTRAEFVETLASRFDLGASAGRSKATLLGDLESFARDRQARGEVTALVIDEAQALPDELLEEIRLLANMETKTGKLLPVVLAGQPEFAERLNEHGLRQLKQRVALRCEIRPLSLQDTASYIASRICKAGGEPGKIFTREAVILIHEYSKGVPRTISVMCDNSLICGFARDQRHIDGKIVDEVCRDFDLRPAAGALQPPSPTPPDRGEPNSAAPPTQQHGAVDTTKPVVRLEAVAPRADPAPASRNMLSGPWAKDTDIADESTGDARG